MVTRIRVILLTCVALTACGDDGAGPGEPGALNEELRTALQNAGVVAVTPPPAERQELVTLGQALFFDPILSGNQNISCATCHHPVAHTGDDLPLSLGEGSVGLAEGRALGEGFLIPRNAPAVFNAGVEDVISLFWDSRVHLDPAGRLVTPEPRLNGADPTLPQMAALLESVLSAQAMFPVTSADEMRGQPGENNLSDLESNVAIWDALVARLVGREDDPGAGIEEYRQMFRDAYPDLLVPRDVNFAHAARAMAAFQRDRWTALGTPLDRFLQGDVDVMTDEEKRGGVIFFGKARCGTCHGGPLLTDFLHHARAVPQIGPGKEEPSEDRGLGRLTGKPADDYRFRTPPLRNVALTGPWMHDGAMMSLEEAVVHSLDPAASFAAFDGSDLPPLFAGTLDTDPARNQARLDAMEPMVPVVLTAAELQDLMAFLEGALTDASSLDLMADLPESVPSGLPVER
ncbi:MAG TPA: cytochrome c peroxidase [Longimicrobiales bacterium]|jgi:cytochrome c peroxidase